MLLQRLRCCFRREAADPDLLCRWKLVELWPYTFDTSFFTTTFATSFASSPFGTFSIRACSASPIIVSPSPAFAFSFHHHHHLHHHFFFASFSTTPFTTTFVRIITTTFNKAKVPKKFCKLRIVITNLLKVWRVACSRDCKGKLRSTLSVLLAPKSNSPLAKRSHRGDILQALFSSSCLPRFVDFWELRSIMILSHHNIVSVVK
mmetsp:Transcript_28652/g.51033  ORF Transcript_28652/g.51033 Transcript_28652/m.51033 type:complete len:204 (-) Transcript_28652:50-661(-)